MSAAGAGHESIVRLLLDESANVHAKDSWKRTALFYAKDNKTVVNLLLNAGVDISEIHSWYESASKV